MNRDRERLETAYGCLNATLPEFFRTELRENERRDEYSVD